MTRLLLAGAFALVAFPAMAWDTPAPAQTASSNATAVSGAASRASVHTTQAQRQHQTATGGSATGGAATGSVVVSGAGNTEARPSIAYGGDFPAGARCPGTGANGGGVGLIGVLTGYSSYSTDCAAIERAEFYRSIGQIDMATALLAHHFPEDQAVRASLHPEPAPGPSFCDMMRYNDSHAAMTAAQLAQFRKECEFH